ncbi:hypothetical protein BCV72DRAFT_107470 [Rhizopus microsporus var. microsporus]|uniref:Uncharacterized protein n=1 Tax=Rhizopus microsporus var. microsporus TaxID=86635 RepID=A0A1X0QLS7_RHIZD|nr:hypothetical protein BCV72DRAFT_107470 [Rhizopus microsporus var. microsporus]
MHITKDQAICMFYYVEYTHENVTKYRNMLESQNYEICFNTNECEPILVMKQRMLGNPVTYCKYLDVVKEKEETGVKRKKSELVTESQVIQFVNSVYTVNDFSNPEIYQEKLTSTNDIFETVNENSTVLNNKTLLAFTRWCSGNRLKFLNAVEDKNYGARKRNLFVMDKIYHDCLITSITEYLPNYQQSLKALQNNAFEIVGYVRKSPTADILDNRVELLQQMVDNLRSRSFATRIFVSSSSRASTAFAERDLNVDQNIYQQLDKVDGTTQDFIKYLNASRHSICLAVLDFAGLSSRSHHVQELLKDYPVIKKVAVDTFMFSNELFIYDTRDLKANTNLLEKFDCRYKLMQRSK